MYHTAGGVSLFGCGYTSYFTVAHIRLFCFFFAVGALDYTAVVSSCKQNLQCICERLGENIVS